MRGLSRDARQPPTEWLLSPTRSRLLFQQRGVVGQRRRGGKRSAAPQRPAHTQPGVAAWEKAKWGDRSDPAIAATGSAESSANGEEQRSWTFLEIVSMAELSAGTPRELLGMGPPCSLAITKSSCLSPQWETAEKSHRNQHWLCKTIFNCIAKSTAVLTAIRWLVLSGSWAAVLLAVPQDFTCFPHLHLQVRFAVALKVTGTACTHFHSGHNFVSSPKTKSQKYQLCHLCPLLHRQPYSPKTQQAATWRWQVWCGYTATAHRTPGQPAHRRARLCTSLATCRPQRDQNQVLSPAQSFMEGQMFVIV